MRFRTRAANVAAVVVAFSGERREGGRNFSGERREGGRGDGRRFSGERRESRGPRRDDLYRSPSFRRRCVTHADLRIHAA